MADTNHTIRMAMASQDDIEKLYLLYNVIENIVKHDAIYPDDFDHFKEEEKKNIDFIFESDEINHEAVITLAYELMWGFHRVVMGFEVLRDNCADLSLDYLDFNKDIKEERRILNLIADHLEKGRKGGYSLSIDPSDSLGKAIMEWAKEEEVDHG